MHNAESLLCAARRHQSPHTETAIRRLGARPYSGWLTTFCYQRQTQKLMQCLAERQALADGDPLRVIADRGLEAQPHSAGSR